MIVSISRLQDGRGECWMMDGIREMLCFQTERMVFPVSTTTLADPSLINIVCGIEMDTGHSGIYLHSNSGQFRACHCC